MTRAALLLLLGLLPVPLVVSRRKQNVPQGSRVLSSRQRVTAMSFQRL